MDESLQREIRQIEEQLDGLAAQIEFKDGAIDELQGEVAGARLGGAQEWRCGRCAVWAGGAGARGARRNWWSRGVIRSIRAGGTNASPAFASRLLTSVTRCVAWDDASEGRPVGAEPQAQPRTSGPLRPTNLSLTTTSRKSSPR